ncbi:uncharacterized protein Tco025E_03695 [Trypanosoma conorhini]|uniref:Uncharacterized protein n=1 Tax=Trypanosoma conorhini TaxID=83891 RepID=A0A422PSJ0_9TRYP|nr:uncharacterized protein Tco025E_03695 [Trypanosoma conorhini]RNF20668.1 hypothetical protein Tco025E_03695 [Trypanosoma conorhini]
MAGARQPRAAPRNDTTVTVALRRRLLQGSDDANAAVVRVSWRRRDLALRTPPPWRPSRTAGAEKSRAQGRGPRKGQPLCARCRLSRREWQYCGLTGEQHVVEE